MDKTEVGRFKLDEVERYKTEQRFDEKNMDSQAD